MIISIPWPGAKLSPNGGQKDWRGKAAARKKYKETCVLECIAQGVRPISDPLLRLDITFYPPKNYRYDLDNALSRLKAALDAIAEKIGVDDAEWPEIRLIRGHKVKGGAVSVHIVTE